MTKNDFSNSIQEASSVVGKTWPLYSFVTSNPLSGYEGTPFKQAIQEAKKYTEAGTLPSGSMFHQAWEHGEIDRDIIRDMLEEAHLYQLPETYLGELESEVYGLSKNKSHELDRLLSKWLSVFMDEGLAEWEMPGKSKGFFSAWRELAIYDRELAIKSINEIPVTADEALASVLASYTPQEYLDIFKNHIAALPGWTGYIKYRMTANSEWQQKYPITLEDYLAVRLWIARQIDVKIVADNAVDEPSKFAELQYIWLKAWEKSWQNKLAGRLYKNLPNVEIAPGNKNSALAQLVFCIDTRSELIRRHVEAKGDYETFGYAGFFGIATDYQDPVSGLVRKSCPPILESAYIISETADTGKTKEFARYKKQKEDAKLLNSLLNRLKNMLPSAFGYVEGAGLFYGCKLLWRTLFPAHSTGNPFNSIDGHEGSCAPEIHHCGQDDANVETISTDEKISIVRSAFQMLGWKTFAPVVILAGHGSHSANNPFGSSLDCGACAASPGRHNARMLAKLANQPEVRVILKEKFDIDIPDNTFFIGAEHDTATEEIVLFDAEVPESHHRLIRSLKSDLIAIQQSAIAERSGSKEGALQEAYKKVGSWAETRPEWGLAGNASFIIAPRNLTKDIDLENRCFLHSYEWEMDEQGNFLESIMQGPMVVTQWINNHYYFSTVDNNKFGGGSKITHNVTGKFGVVQGNGGDLKIGLPLQSVNISDQEIFHQPLRLSVIIQAPLFRVEEILNKNKQLKSLIENEWIYLMVIDPLTSNQINRYQNNGEWTFIAFEKSDQIIAV
ncbi:DUF2309 domain-containing protein [Mucilaginibacter antarcticus]|uniref:Probable inorganic carbon transporter subunit DabA n=1 Tax=Mucilaginibacter antarcticus TaxID=1855725 RepID=A0ABW5XTA9_9SPHI